jgi:hypothetical protein
MNPTITAETWVDKNVDLNGLLNDVVSALQESINQENIEDGTYIALVHDIVSGSAGRYIPAFALQFFDYRRY